MNYLLSRIAAICGGELTGADREVRSVFTDSRRADSPADALFVAIAGHNHDGHGYINALYDRGVRAFVIERDVNTKGYDQAGFVRVESSVAALQALAADYRAGFKGTVVGITGSNGKTVVKEWISQMAPQGVKLFRSPRSYNSQIGVPLSILMIEGDESFALIEAGISRAGEMERLERIIRPDVGIITTLGEAHREGFASGGEKLSEKLKLFRDARTVLYNSDYKEVEAALRRSFSGRLVNAAGRRSAYAFFPDPASRENAAMALTACGELFGEHTATDEELLARLQPVAMRLEVKEGLSGSLIVDDAYNCDINSLGIAIDYLRSAGGGRPTMVVLSDILQSGLPAAELYGRVARMVAAAGVDYFVGVGEEIRHHEALFAGNKSFFPTTESFLASINYADIAHRAILIKGNRPAHFELLSHALQLRSHTTTLEVDLDALVHNLNYHRSKLAPGTRLMAMVKAAGYGHGTAEVAAALQHEGVAYLAVAFADEGVTLREKGISMPIVVLNADSDSFELMLSHNLEPEIYNAASLRAFAATLARHSERGYPIHIKLDTGMHRLGFAEDDIPELLRLLADNRLSVRVSSVFSHLAASDDPAQDDFTRTQLERFERMSADIMRPLNYKVIRHIANSAAIERFPGAQYDMCRLGIGLYGFGAGGLRPVSTLSSRIVQIKELAAGETVGYGRAGVARQAMRIATIPMGYADGLNRRLGEGRWSVLIGGHAAPTVGRVCMDTCMVDVTGIPAAEGDRAVIFGPQPGNTAADMACALDTIPYEILTGISSRVKRIYIKE